MCSSDLGDKVAKVHGKKHVELLEIQKLIHTVSDELTTHMKKEELILFPFIKKLVQAKKEHSTVETPHFGTVNNPIQMMEEEHDLAGDIFKRLSELTNRSQTPIDHCNTSKSFSAKHEEFEDDFHQHVHSENTILFPTSILIESQL